MEVHFVSCSCYSKWFWKQASFKCSAWLMRSFLSSVLFLIFLLNGQSWFMILTSSLFSFHVKQRGILDLCGRRQILDSRTWIFATVSLSMATENPGVWVRPFCCLPMSSILHVWREPQHILESPSVSHWARSKFKASESLHTHATTGLFT